MEPLKAWNANIVTLGDQLSVAKCPNCGREKQQAPNIERLSTMVLCDCMTKKRPLYVIAKIIAKDWTNIKQSAIPSLEAMVLMMDETSSYGQFTGAEVIDIFLHHAKAWRSPLSKEIKLELIQIRDGNDTQTNSLP